MHDDHKAACADDDVKRAAELIADLRKGLWLSLAVAQATQKPDSAAPLTSGFDSIATKLKLDPVDPKRAAAMEMLECCYRIATETEAPSGVSGFWPSLRRGALLEGVTERLLASRPVATRRDVLFRVPRWESRCIDVVGLCDAGDCNPDFEALECKIDPIDLTDVLLDELAEIPAKVSGEASVLVGICTLQGNAYLDAMLEDLSVPENLVRVTLETMILLAEASPTIPLRVAV